ncbi:MAG TPA: presqualene diphosphate synthase HpnD [Blastocatellia bacterium]|nr:presqualene diphosphate synthase HpnD [Blastocatellia bacterium]
MTNVTSLISNTLEAPQKLAKATGSNFYYAFLFLPRSKREAIKNVYGFCRIIDDIVDEDAAGRDPAAELDEWREEIHACYQGLPSKPFGERLTESIEEFDLPKQSFLDLIDGMQMDLEFSKYQTFADLREYCYRVASAVGLICIEIFGYQSLRTREYAINLGLALQLTNILRDLKEDTARGRFYIPIEDQERFGYRERDFQSNLYNAPFIDMMKFQTDRAASYYDKAAGALADEDRASMFAAETMGAIYRELLEAIRDVRFDVYRNRVSVPGKRRVRLALEIWLKGKFGRLFGATPERD